MKTTISRNALFKRVTRKLAHDGLRLHRCRFDSTWLRSLGRFYTTNQFNHVDGISLDNDFELLDFAKEIGVVTPNVVLAD